MGYVHIDITLEVKQVVLKEELLLNIGQGRSLLRGQQGASTSLGGFKKSSLVQEKFSL